MKYQSYSTQCLKVSSMVKVFRQIYRMTERRYDRMTDSCKYRILFYTNKKASFSSKSYSESMIKTKLLSWQIFKSGRWVHVNRIPPLRLPSIQMSLPVELTWDFCAHLYFIYISISKIYWGEHLFKGFTSCTICHFLMLVIFQQPWSLSL